jgi:hypothetical protein
MKRGFYCLIKRHTTANFNIGPFAFELFISMFLDGNVPLKAILQIVRFFALFCVIILTCLLIESPHIEGAHLI